MEHGIKVEEFVSAEKLLYADVQAHIFADRGVDSWGELSGADEKDATAELKQAVQDKRELLAMLREQEPVVALEECREALAFAEQIAGGVEGYAKFEVALRYVRCEDVKPEYAEEAATLAELCKPFLAKLDTELEKLEGRIEAAKGKAVADASKQEKIEELKRWREVAIIEERDPAEVDAQIIAIQTEQEQDEKAAALAAEEAEILTRHAEKVKERRDAVAAIAEHIAAVADAFRAFLLADKYNKTAHELGSLVQEFAELSKQVAKAEGFLRVPETNGCRLSFELPRLEGSLAYVDDWGKYTRRIYYGPERDLIVKI